MSKEKRKLTPAEKTERQRRRQEYMTIFVNGQQKRVKRPPTIDGLDMDEFIRRNADPLWYHQNEMQECIEPEHDSAMDVVTDIPKIEALAKEKEEENWGYRAFLKGIDLESEEIDAIGHRIYEEVAKQIDCLQCGHCCRVMTPIIDTEDIKRLAKATGMTEQAFIDKYLAKAEAEPGLEFKLLPCPFQSGNACTVYEDRPEDCRDFPHLHKPEFASRLSGAVENCSVCPISFNVFERLKQELPVEPTLLYGEDF